MGSVRRLRGMSPRPMAMVEESMSDAQRIGHYRSKHCSKTRDCLIEGKEKEHVNQNFPHQPTTSNELTGNTLKSLRSSDP